MHRREGFHGKEVRDRDRPRPAHPADVVAQQIDDHQVLRSVLVGAGERLGHPGILGGIRVARPGALDGLGLDMALVEQQETLRGEAQNGAVRQADKGGERRLVGGAQGEIGGPFIP